MTRENLTTSNRRWGKKQSGVPRWSPELGVEGIIRERGSPSGPQNWGWRASSERGDHQEIVVGQLLLVVVDYW